MEHNGESYSTAAADHPAARADSKCPWHFAGSVPATTALPSLLSQAGVASGHGEAVYRADALRDRRRDRDRRLRVRYEKEDFASFLIAGRHLWQDDLAYLTAALGRSGSNRSSAKRARRRRPRRPCETAAGRAVVAWVDMASLPHRGMPAEWSGGGYDVVTVYRIEADRSASSAT